MKARALLLALIIFLQSTSLTGELRGEYEHPVSGNTLTVNPPTKGDFILRILPQGSPRQ